jgi:hypothetical protein
MGRAVGGKEEKMPSKSKKQERMMAAAAHDPAFAKKVGVPVGVAKEFNEADTKRRARVKALRG